MCLLQKNFSRSGLVRRLDAWGLVEIEGSRQDVAERIAHWVGVSDAIELHAVHQSLRSEANARPARPDRARIDEAETTYRHGRTGLEEAVAAAASSVRHAAEADYTLYRQRHAELQRSFELRVGALRAQVRQAVCRIVPGLRPLAALDAALEPILIRQEQQLFSAVPALLGKRFEALRSRDPMAQAKGGQADDSARAGHPGAWREQFRAEWRSVLQAELDVRLEPVQGLMDAMRREVGKYQ